MYLAVKEAASTFETLVFPPVFSPDTKTKFSFEPASSLITIVALLFPAGIYSTQELIISLP